MTTLFQSISKTMGKAMPKLQKRMLKIIGRAPGMLVEAPREIQAANMDKMDAMIVMIQIKSNVSAVMKGKDHIAQIWNTVSQIKELLLADEVDMASETLSCKLMQSFNKFDTSNNGYLDEAETVAMVAAMGLKVDNDAEAQDIFRRFAADQRGVQRFIKYPKSCPLPAAQDQPSPKRRAGPPRRSRKGGKTANPRLAAALTATEPEPRPALTVGPGQFVALYRYVQAGALFQKASEKSDTVGALEKSKMLGLLKELGHVTNDETADKIDALFALFGSFPKNKFLFLGETRIF